MADIGFGPIKINPGRDKMEKARSPYKIPTKDFRKVLKQEQEEGRQDQEENIVKEGSEGSNSKKSQRAPKEKKEVAQQTNVSLFDLSKEAGKKEMQQDEKKLTKKKIEGEGIDEEVQQESLTAFMRQVYAKKSEMEADDDAVAMKADTTGTSRFTQEQADLSYVNPLATGATTTLTSNIQTAIPASKAAEMVEIMERLVDKLYIVEKSGQTDTTITLSHPPQFEGARLVISSFDSARGEFNLSFEGLTQQGKTILDLPDNQNALRMALDQKGYVVHIMTTTTFEETNVAVKGEALPQRDREKGEQESEKEQQEQE